MDVQVNLLAVFLAAVSSMAVGSIWYSKAVFGDAWAKLVKIDQKQMKKGAGQAMAMAFVAAILMAYVLAHVAYLSNQFFKNTFMADSLMTGFWLWLGISATTIVIHNAFEQKRKKLTLLAAGNQLVTFLVMAVIIGWLKP